MDLFGAPYFESLEMRRQRYSGNRPSNLNLAGVGNGNDDFGLGASNVHRAGMQSRSIQLSNYVIQGEGYETQGVNKVITAVFRCFVAETLLPLGIPKRLGMKHLNAACELGFLPFIEEEEHQRDTVREVEARIKDSGRIHSPQDVAAEFEASAPVPMRMLAHAMLHRPHLLHVYGRFVVRASGIGEVDRRRVLDARTHSMAIDEKFPCV